MFDAATGWGGATLRSTSAPVDTRYCTQRLPEEAANELLAMLLANGHLDRPHLLALFQHAATRLHLTPTLAPHAAGAVDGTWAAYARELEHLAALSLQGCPRLRDAHLAGPWASAAALTELSLAGCAGLAGACLSDSTGALAQLTSLRSLDLSGAAAPSRALEVVCGPSRVASATLRRPVRAGCGAGCTGLAAPLHLPSWPGLTRLCVADVPAFDDEAAGLLPDALPALRHLGAAGTPLGLAGAQMLGFCGALAHLDVSWTAVDALPALPTLEVRFAFARRRVADRARPMACVR